MTHVTPIKFVFINIGKPSMNEHWEIDMSLANHQFHVVKTVGDSDES